MHSNVASIIILYYNLISYNNKIIVYFVLMIIMIFIYYYEESSNIFNFYDPILPPLLIFLKQNFQNLNIKIKMLDVIYIIFSTST